MTRFQILPFWWQSCLLVARVKSDFWQCSEAADTEGLDVQGFAPAYKNKAAEIKKRLFSLSVSFSLSSPQVQIGMWPEFQIRLRTCFRPGGHMGLYCDSADPAITSAYLLYVRWAVLFYICKAIMLMYNTSSVLASLYTLALQAHSPGQVDTVTCEQ